MTRLKSSSFPRQGYSARFLYQSNIYDIASSLIRQRMSIRALPPICAISLLLVLANYSSRALSKEGKSIFRRVSRTARSRLNVCAQFPSFFQTLLHSLSNSIPRPFLPNIPPPFLPSASASSLTIIHDVFTNSRDEYNHAKAS